MASNSFCSRSAGGHGSADGSTSGVRAAGPPNSSDCPTSADSCDALRRSQDRVDRREGARAVASSSSNAPEAARLSSTRLLTARGLMRLAKSERSANGRSPRAATIASTACAPTPLSAASE